MNSLKEQYKNMLRGNMEAAKAKSEGAEEYATELFFKQNPMGNKEDFIKTYRRKLNEPIKAPDANSAEVKFGSNPKNTDYRGFRRPY
jgi:hypothetical protein